MDYEKAYKDLMRNIDVAIEGQTEGETKVVLQNIKVRNMENRDEMIRKEIRDLLVNSCEADRRYPHLLSWLDKQKAQKAIQEVIEKAYVVTLKRLIIDFVRANNRPNNHVGTWYYQQICDWLDGRHVERNLSANLIDAAYNYVYERFVAGADFSEDYMKKQMEKAFIAGAEYEKEQKPADWSDEDEKMRASIVMTLAGFMGNEDKIAWLNSLRNKPSAEQCQPAVSELALKFINYLDRNRPVGKMCLSNGECEDINEAFQKNDLERIMRYVRKYLWRPSEK